METSFLLCLPNCFDSVASCIGGSFIQRILKYSSSEFIMEKLQLYSSQEDNCQYSIKVPQDMEDYFFRRLTSDMNRRHFVDILSNKLFENAANRIQFIKYLEKRVKSENLVDATTGSTQVKTERRNLWNVYYNKKLSWKEIDKMDKKGRTALHYACKAGDKDIVKCLIGSKASINIVDKKGRKPLHIACIKGSLDTVKGLAENKANINESGKDDKTPLHYACENRFGNIVNTLIMENAIVNKLDDQDLTPLHIAGTYGYEEIVKLLLDNKPLTNIKNKQGQTAVSFKSVDTWPLSKAHGCAEFRVGKNSSWVLELSVQDMDIPRLIITTLSMTSGLPAWVADLLEKGEKVETCLELLRNMQATEREERAAE
ncbi:unnamed protein product [Mytilus coruscus]|uniref:Uncharacterized protein n=1 Tax=Mytilus coruscus TaxID=42192 RepID=A0A6J8AV43_MYTCO|nr:unnamed protein product [Mytilus coruscus]